MVGLIEKLENITTSYFKTDNDLIYVLGEDFEELGGSEYLKAVHNTVSGDSPKISLDIEKKLQGTVLSLIDKKLIKSAHDISEGGIISALAECCIINEENPVGAAVDIPVKTRDDFSLFSESQSRIIVSVDKNKKEEFEKILNVAGQSFTFLGTTGGELLSIKNKIEVNLNILSDIYFNTISRIMNA
jgi:phosphoribosylformylglycinamidine synthase